MGGGERGERENYAIKRYGSATYQGDRQEKLTENDEKPRVFISFHVEDEAQVNFLRSQAKDGKLEFVDYSVKEPFDEKWKTQCTERIKRTEILVVMIGPETHQRDAVEWEIRKAIELGKPVIGIRIYRDQNHPIPRALKEINAKIINWNLDDIQNEINKKKLKK